MSICKVILLGNVGRDAELKYTPSGFPIASFSLATNKKTKEGQITTWHNCKLLGKRAESVAQYIKKGKSLFVEGEIEVRSWDDKKTGQKRTATEILVNELDFVDKFSNDASEQNAIVEDTSDIPF